MRKKCVEILNGIWMNSRTVIWSMVLRNSVPSKLRSNETWWKMLQFMLAHKAAYSHERLPVVVPNNGWISTTHNTHCNLHPVIIQPLLRSKEVFEMFVKWFVPASDNQTTYHHRRSNSLRGFPDVTEMWPHAKHRTWQFSTKNPFGHFKTFLPVIQCYKIELFPCLCELQWIFISETFVQFGSYDWRRSKGLVCIMRFCGEVRTKEGLSTQKKKKKRKTKARNEFLSNRTIESVVLVKRWGREYFDTKF